MDINNRLPEVAGRHRDVPAAFEHGMTVRQLRVTSATSLVDLSTDFVFFHFGLLLCAGLPVDPVLDHVNSQPGDVDVAVLEFDQPLIDRMPDPLCRKLWVCAKEHWHPLDLSLRAVSILNRQAGWLASSFRHTIELMDILAMEKRVILPTPVPTVELVVYGVMGPGKTYYLEAAKNPPIDRPGVMCCASPESQGLFQKSLLRNEDKPFEDLENEDTHPAASKLRGEEG